MQVSPSCTTIPCVNYRLLPAASLNVLSGKGLPCHVSFLAFERLACQTPLLPWAASLLQWAAMGPWTGKCALDSSVFSLRSCTGLPGTQSAVHALHSRRKIVEMIDACTSREAAAAGAAFVLWAQMLVYDAAAPEASDVGEAGVPPAGRCRQPGQGTLQGTHCAACSRRCFLARGIPAVQHLSLIAFRMRCCSLWPWRPLARAGLGKRERCFGAAFLGAGL